MHRYLASFQGGGGRGGEDGVVLLFSSSTEKLSPVGSSGEIGLLLSAVPGNPENPILLASLWGWIMETPLVRNKALFCQLH